MALAGAGLWLTGSPTPVEVSLNQDAYTIGGARLDAQGGGVYQSEHGVVIVRGNRAAASATLGNEHATGACDIGPGSSTQHCRFTVNGRPVESWDQRTDSGWHRRYDDGEEVDIKVEGGGAAPVPFPLGR
jgi:hypothetical protein